MRKIFIASVLLYICLGASNAFAGKIFGDITVEGKPAPAGITVEIALAPSPAEEGKAPKPAPARLDSTATDKFGSYKVSVKPEGKCVLTLTYQKQPYTLEVFSYKNATRYDLVLEKKEGKFSLRRK